MPGEFGRKRLARGILTPIKTAKSCKSFYCLQYTKQQSDGRADLVADHPCGTFIFELKVGRLAKLATTEAQRKRYAAPYAAAGKPVWVIGLAFIYNTDGNDMFRYPSNRLVSTAAFKSLRLDFAKNTAIRTVSYCPISSGFGYFTVPGIGEYNTTSWPCDTDLHGVYPKNAGNIAHYNAARAFERELGTDALAMAEAWCRENGCLFFASVRFNDTHDQDPNYGHFHFPPFKVQHPECLMGTREKRPKVCSWTAVDFAQPLVREKMRTFVRQFFEKYDLDGLEIDFFRHAQVFKSVASGGTASDGECSVMTELMAYVRDQARRAEQRRGHPVLVSIRTPDSVGYCRAIGLDVETWLRRKLVDIWVVTGYFQQEHWHTTAAFAHRHGVRVYASMDESRISNFARRRKQHFIEGRDGDANLRGRFAAALAAGCDGIYLFNREYRWLTRMAERDPRELIGMDKLYFATERGSGGYRPGSWLVNGDRFDKMPKVDPGDAVKLKPGERFSFDMMLGEDFPAAERLGLKPTVTVLALVDDSSTTAVTIEGHRLIAGARENGATAYAVDPALLRRGLNAVTVVSSTDNVLHDFAVRVTYSAKTR